MQRTAGPEADGPFDAETDVLDGRADHAEDLADLATKEQKRNDRDDGDQGEDQRVLGETLAFLIITLERSDESRNVRHAVGHPLSVQAPRNSRRRRPTYG
jgi:hypothetical protein